MSDDVGGPTKLREAFEQMVRKTEATIGKEATDRLIAEARAGAKEFSDKWLGAQTVIVQKTDTGGSK